MRWVRFAIDGEPRFGVEVDGRFVDLAAAASALRRPLRHAVAAIDAMAGGERAIDEARSILDAIEEWDDPVPGVWPVESARRLAPIARPGKIVAVGKNYADHCAEQGEEPPKKPLFFMKLTTSVIGDGDAITFRRDVSEKVDYEAELAIVIGRRGRDIPLESAFDHVAGYTVVNDVTARDLQKSDSQWSRAKGLDTFCPMGPCIVSQDEIADPHALGVRSFVNGEPRQSSSTRHFVFDIPALIHRLSQCVTLEPGDLIPTGTPGGVGCYLDPPVFLQDGDVVAVEVDGIGRITNPVRELV